MITLKTNQGNVYVQGSPSDCPFCHTTIMPNFLYGHLNKDSMEVILTCPNPACNRSFIGYYDYKANSKFCNFLGQTTIGNIVSKNFSETINKISKDFTAIYNEAFAAEQQKLNEICGVGYRKALEFLIKDYIILNKPEEKTKVENKLLGACIKEYVDDNRIKTVAKRAAWLGNDETHYIRKWEGNNLKDLKTLIDLTVHWIEMEDLTKSFGATMPD